jgi:hypothetical protein
MGHVECMGEMIDAYKIMVRKPEQKRELGRPRHRWKYKLECTLGK